MSTPFQGSGEGRMGNKMTLMRKIDCCLTKAEECFLILGILSMGIVMTCQVFGRMLLNQSIVWSEELARHIFICTIFIGMSHGVAKKFHVSLEYFVDKFPPALKKAVMVAMNAAVVVLLAYLFLPALIYAEDQMRIQAPTMGYRMGYVMLAMPMSIVLTIFRLLQDMARIVRIKEAAP
jgi:TRAP-type C4-dicarboxylate transport system permease small subunit